MFYVRSRCVSTLVERKNGTVTICHSRTKNLKEITKRADILIVAIGKPCFVTADYVKDSSEVKPLLEQQVCSSVRWQQSVERMIADGVDEFVEIGPGKTLSGFMKKINKEVTVYNIDKMEDFERFVSEHPLA